MTKEILKTMRATSPEQRSALASALRLEILGLFTSREELSVSDMARLMGRKPPSLYYHVGILEEAGLIQRVGARRKGKRFETLFRPAARRYEFEADASAAEDVVKTLRLAFRMSERELAAALAKGVATTEGARRTVYATRMHLRLSPEMLEEVNAHLSALEELLSRCAAPDRDPGPEDHLQSLTIAFLPLRDREGFVSDADSSEKGP